MIDWKEYMKMWLDLAMMMLPVIFLYTMIFIVTTVIPIALLIGGLYFAFGN